MSESESQFDDPQLKAALRRALPAETAPTALRGRIAQALDAEASQAAKSAQTSHALRWKPRRLPMIITAVAALLLLGLFGLYWKLWRTIETGIEPWFADAMVEIHDSHEKLPDHHLLTGIPNDDLDAIRTALSAQLKHPVMAASPGDGWQFIGACVTKIRDTPVAHLMFKRGDETLSVFSISSAPVYMGFTPNGAVYAQMVRNHPVSGFLYNNSVNCVVYTSSSHPTTVDQAKQIRDKLQRTLGMFGKRSLW
jgi:hypothetical protein